MASIKIIQGPDRGKVFALPDGDNIVGREGGSIELADGTVSRRHILLSCRDGKCRLSDLGSANGTYLNGMKVKKPSALNPGDQIRCGSSLLLFVGSDSLVTIKAPAMDVDKHGMIVDSSIVATVPSSEDSIVIPTPEAGAAAIGNLRFIYELLFELGSIFDIDEILRRTLEKLFEVFPVDRGYTMLFDDDQLQLKSSMRSDGSTDDNPPISHTIINEVISKHVGILSTNAMHDKRFTAGKSVHDYGIRSAVCVPVKGRDKILGVIHLDCSISDHTYSTEQLRLLTAVGHHVGLAIDNVRLHIAAVQSERLAAMGETVALLSHHTKNILQALISAIDVLGMSLESGDIDKAKKSWPIIQRNISRINDMILNMLAFSKDREPILENIDVNEVLKDCVELLDSQAADRGVAIIYSPDELPKIPADQAGLRQAVENLLNNALDAIEDRKGAITVTSKNDTMNRSVIIIITDNGIGIPDDQLSQIFTPFYSGKGHGGTGLGLAVTKKIINEHHGQIDVTSQAAKGTTFTITLPQLQS